MGCSIAGRLPSYFFALVDGAGYYIRKDASVQHRRANEKPVSVPQKEPIEK